MTDPDANNNIDDAGGRFTVELAADGSGPPAAVRLRHWLKLAKRSHGLRCAGVAAVPEVPTDHLAQTNAVAGHWRPSGRAIHRAAGAGLTR